jgi:hypothetical protein
MHLDVEWIHERYDKLKKSGRLEWYVPLADIFIDWVDWRMWGRRSLSMPDQDDMARLEMERNWIIFGVGKACQRKI